MSEHNPEGPALHAFGDWRFDPISGELSDATSTQRLEPQVSRVLDYFLVHQGTLVSRDDLVTALWDARAVSDDAVNRCISILRHTLTPGDRNAFIETVVRRGFISHFPPPAERRTDEEAPPERGRRFRRPLALAGLAAFLLVGLVWLTDRPARPEPAPSSSPMIAVLPFASTDPGGDSAFFADGMHSDLMTQLAQLESMQVISSNSVAHYRDEERDIRRIGAALGADAILQGGVQAVGSQIRINVQLIDARSDVHLWAAQYNRELTPHNIFDIQAEIARAVASALNATLSAREVKQLTVLPTQNMAAYRAFHEAMEIRKTRTIAAPEYIAALERAVSLDPAFVRAWSELAGSLSFANIGSRDPESMLRLEETLERIRALAPKSSDYLIAQAYYTYYVLKDYRRSLALISRARTLRPSDVQVLELQSWIQRRLFDYPSMIDTIRRASDLDPGSAYQTLRLATNLTLAHRYDDAVEVIDNSRVDSFEIALLGNLLRVRDHGEPGRLPGDIRELEREYGEKAIPIRLWEAHIAARDFSGAIALLDGFENAGLYQEEGLTRDSWSFLTLPDPYLAGILTRHLAGDFAAPPEALQALHETLVRSRDSGDLRQESDFHLSMAMVSAVQGRRAETARWIRTWMREARTDPPELVNQREYACRALGLAGVLAATLDCLRSALVEPSKIMPFLEPHLPYYDTIRDKPDFRTFVAELESQ
jgi:TolB-like protein/DNA-binding winged helix-turn-helix (wHTH) protein